VRMTCENHPRTTGYRLLFYALRFATLAAVCLWVPWAALILLLFYLFARRMPYDYLP